MTDVFVNIVSEQFETPSNNSIGIGIGTGGRNAGVGVSGGIPIRPNSMNQLFIVDLIDVTNDVLIWQAKYEGKFNRNLTSEAKNKYFETLFARSKLEICHYKPSLHSSKQKRKPYLQSSKQQSGN